MWPKFGPQILFLWVLSLLDVRHCCKLSLYAIPRKTNYPNQGNSEKPQFGPNLGLLGPNLGRHHFFLRNLASSVTRYYGQLLLCTISEKTNDPILRKCIDRWTDKQPDETDGREGFHRTLSD